MESVRQSKVYFKRFNIVPLKNTASLQNKLADLRVRFSRTKIHTFSFFVPIPIEMKICYIFFDEDLLF